MRCPQCASDNPADYRFCGMCGTPLENAAPERMTRVATSSPEEPVTVPAERPSQVQRFVPSSRSNRGSSLLGLSDVGTVEPRAPQRAAEHFPPERQVSPERPIAQERPAIEERISPPPSGISGPSFLGLGESTHGGYGETSRDLNYLFDEDEQPRRSYGRFIAIVLVLAVCAGLGYLQYRRGGKSWTAPWSKGPAQTPVQASQSQPQDQTNTAATQSANNAPSPSAGQSGDQPPNAQDRPADGTLKESDIPPQAGQSASGAGTAAQGGTPASGEQAAAGSAAGSGEQAADTQAAKGDETDNKKQETTETASAAPPAGKDKAAAKENAATAKESTAAANDSDEEAADVRPAKKQKPSPQVAPPDPDESLVANAEKYLYGRGVPQNCDRALISLRAAANRQNSRAQILLGSMYFTGHCVSKDLPNSYRWYAQASRQSPDNMLVQKNLEMIWRTMTPAERQLATARQ